MVKKIFVWVQLIDLCRDGNETGMRRVGHSHSHSIEYFCHLILPPYSIKAGHDMIKAGRGRAGP